MGRIIGAVVAGYVVLAVLVFATFTGLYLLMGPGLSFVPGSCEASALWIGLSTLLGFGAAVGGGCVACRIARAKGAKALAAVVVALGLLLAIPVILSASAHPAFDCSDATNMEAMQNARQPIWVALLNPFIGAAGVLLGGRCRPKPE